MGLESLGGQMPAGQPVAVTSSNRTDVFAIAAGGGLNHWSSTNGAPWSGPVPLPSGNHPPSFPCAIALPDGSVNVFAIVAGGALMRWRSTDGLIWATQLCPFISPIPANGNGLAAASRDGQSIDVFAITPGGIIHYSFSPGQLLLPPGMVPLPNSTGLFPAVLAAVSSEPGKLDVFAVEPNVGMPLRWHFNGAWNKQFVAGPPLNRNRNNGFAAVSPAPGRVELFAITGDRRMTNWSFTGTTFISRQLPMGTWSLPDGVPAVIAGSNGKLDLFAIGPGDIFKGGPLIHWRFDGQWSEPAAYDASLAAGGVTAARGASGLDAFAFNSGTNNSLQHWPGGIHGASSDPWANWANNRQASVQANTLQGHCYPTCLEELVEIVRSAAQENKRVRAVGSSWSFSDIAVTSGYVVETNKMDKVIQNTIVPNALDTNTDRTATRVTGIPLHHLVHVEAGIQLENLMTFLDETGRAPYTMGGAAGQTLAGVISTSVHGSHFRIGPFPDWVRAIHLVGPDGRQHWIEPKDKPITDESKLRTALGPDVEPHYNNDWFDSVLVSVGGLGIVYSVVIEVRDAYKLRETRSEVVWQALRPRIAAGTVFTDVTDGAPDAVQVAIDPGSMSKDDPDCYLTVRKTVPMDTPSTQQGAGMDSGLAAFCEGDRWLVALYQVASPPVLASILGLLPLVPVVGPALLPLVPVLTPIILTAQAIPYLYQGLRAAGPGAAGDLIGMILDQHPGLTALLISELTNELQKPGPEPAVNLAHQIMAPRNRGECVARGLALEVAFDMADGSHLSYIDAAIRFLQDEAAMGRFLGGWFSLRFVGKSRAILSPQRTDMTCMVEFVAIRKLSSTEPLLLGLEVLARSHGGIQHWGMLEDIRYEDVARAYPRLDTWLRVRQQLTNDGTMHTFDNDFMARCGLIPTAPKMLLRNPNDGAIYVIYGGAKFHVPDPDTLNRLYLSAGASVRDAQEGELEHIGTIPGDGTILHEETTGKVFAIINGAKYHVPDWNTLTSQYPGFLLRPLWENALAHIPDYSAPTIDVVPIGTILMPPLTDVAFPADRIDRVGRRDPIRRQNVEWEHIGHANDVVAMAASNGKLFAVTRDNFLWSRDPIGQDVDWERIGPANDVVAMAAVNDRLFAATNDNRLLLRVSIGRRVRWDHIGQANDVVAMTAINNKLFAATSDNRLLWRDPVGQDVEWEHIGHANDVVAMAAINDKLFAATRDDRLWWRDPVGQDVEWEQIGNAGGVVAMAAINGKLFAATNDNRLLWRDPVR